MQYTNTKYISLGKRLLSTKRGKIFSISLITLLCLITLILLPMLLNRVQDQIVLAGVENERVLKPDEAKKDKIVQEVNKLIDVPIDVEVFIGTISNVNELGWRAQYLKKATKGDILLVFPHMTIIFDPTTNTIRDISSEDLLHKDEDRIEYLKKQS